MDFNLNRLEGDLEDLAIRIEGIHSLLAFAKTAAKYPCQIDMVRGLFMMELESSAILDDINRIHDKLEGFLDEKTT